MARSSAESIHIRGRQGSVAEFGPALFVFLFMALFPMIDLLAVAVGAATISLGARQAASAAASSPNYSDALAATKREANAMINSGFGRFVNLTPVTGYGADLWSVRTNILSSAVQYAGPNNPCEAPVDQANYVYEYAVVCKYQVGPMCNLGAIPVLGSVPGLGTPATIKCVSTMATEFPDGQPVVSLVGGDGSNEQPASPWVTNPSF